MLLLKIKQLIIDWYFIFRKYKLNVFCPLKAFIRRNASREYSKLVSLSRSIKMSDDLYFDIVNKIFLYGLPTCEDLSMYKVFDFKDKNVLDIGAYIGDTAILFKKWGANKVICYEPIKENVKKIKKIAKLYGWENDIIVRPYAVWNKNGIVIFYVEKRKIETPYLRMCEGNYRIKLKCKSFEDVLKDAIRNDVAIVKIDCEGCEKYLLNVNKELIKKIPFWIIEAHDKEIYANIFSLFIRLGFKVSSKLVNPLDLNLKIIVAKKE